MKSFKEYAEEIKKEEVAAESSTEEDKATNDVVKEEPKTE